MVEKRLAPSQVPDVLGAMHKFLGYQSAASVALSAGAWKVVEIDTALFDTAAAFDGYNNRWVCPETGYYMVNGQVYLDTPATPDKVEYVIGKYDAPDWEYPDAWGAGWMNDEHFTSWPVGQLMRLVMGEFVTLGVNPAIATNIFGGVGDSSLTFMHILGPFGA